MRRVINYTNMSLDGVIELMERWHFDYVDGETDALVSELLSTSDAMVMGRRTYQGFAEVWPHETGAIADKLNAMRKYVASRTLAAAEWNNSTIISGDIAAEVKGLKDEDGGDIITWGIGPVAESLLSHGLMDVIHIAVHPVLAGVGGLDELLFRPGNAARFELSDHRVLGSGVVVLTYRPS